MVVEDFAPSYLSTHHHEKFFFFNNFFLMFLNNYNSISLREYNMKKLSYKIVSRDAPFIFDNPTYKTHIL